ncbi:MAG: glycosyltransferase family 4 protein [Cytophagales bacterium]|nr:glycosyltransferase family 4 protein [Cytophagales bacterium]
MSIKIAIIDPVGRKAGMDYYDLSLLKSMSELGVETYLFTNYAEENDKIKIFYLFNTNIHSKLKKLFNFISGYRKAFKICRKERVTKAIIHNFSTSLKDIIPFLISKIYKVKIISIAHDISDLANEDVGIIKKLIYNKYSDTIVAHNQFAYNELSKILKPKILKKVHMIKQGGYLDLVNPKITKQEGLKALNLSKKSKYILFFGQIKKVKGLDVLLNALPYIDENIILIIAGRPWKDDFNVYQKIIDLHKTENRVIKIIQYIPDNRRELLFKTADALIIPHKISYQSAVLLMGMSYGLPAIVSDLTVNREIIIDNENGILFKSEDKISLSKKINYLFKNKGLYLKIKKNALQTIKKEYSWDDIAKEYKILLEKI